VLPNCGRRVRRGVAPSQPRHILVRELWRGRKGCLKATINHSYYRSDPCGKKHKATRTNKGRTKEEQRRNARKISRRRSVRCDGAMAQWLRGFESSSLREHESRSCDNNRGTGPCSPSNAKGYGQLHLPYLAFFTPPGALSTLAHQFSEPPAPHLINQKLLTPPSAINLKPVTRFSLRHSAKQNPHCCCLGRVEALVVITCQSVFWTP